MTDQWYYAHNKNKMGPFSGRQLKDLAALGEILPADTVWKQGVEKGALACKVKNLFSLPCASVNLSLEQPTVLSQPSATIPSAEKILPPAQSESSPAAEVTTPAVVLANPAASLQAKTAAVPAQPSAAPKPARKGRAVALKGADIIGQDGLKAKYKKKCTVCGQKDSSYQSITITNKTTTTGYFCPKCRKNRVVVIQCSAG